MSVVSIRVEGLGKRYFIGRRRRKGRTLREVLTDSVSAPVRRARSLVRGQSRTASQEEETIWAVKDISFEIKPGEAVGIIGLNGAVSPTTPRR